MLPGWCASPTGRKVLGLTEEGEEGEKGGGEEEGEEREKGSTDAAADVGEEEKGCWEVYFDFNFV